MHEVRVESLDGLETQEGRMRLSANAGSLSIVFPQEIWEELLANAPTSSEPMPEELEELGHLKAQLEGYADEASCSVLREVPCGDTGLAYDLVLRPAELFAMTTGYYFAPVVDEDALLSGDESLKSFACAAARAVPAVSRCRRSCGGCSRGGSAGGTFRLPQQGDNLCRS